MPCFEIYVGTEGNRGTPDPQPLRSTPYTPTTNIHSSSSTIDINGTITDAANMAQAYDARRTTEKHITTGSFEAIDHY